MRKPMTIVVRSFIVLALLAAVTYSPTPAAACSTFDEYITYYNNCGGGKYEVGWFYRSCGCSISSGGTDGLFKEVDQTSCTGTGEEYITYWGRCNFGDPWQQLAGFDDCPNGC